MVPSLAQTHHVKTLIGYFETRILAAKSTLFSLVMTGLVMTEHRRKLVWRPAWLTRGPGVWTYGPFPVVSIIPTKVSICKYFMSRGPRITRSIRMTS